MEDTHLILNLHNETPTIKYVLSDRHFSKHPIFPESITFKINNNINTPNIVIEYLARLIKTYYCIYLPKTLSQSFKAAHGHLININSYAHTE